MFDCKSQASAAVQAAAAAKSAEDCKNSRPQHGSKFTQRMETVDARADARHQDLPYSVEKDGGTAFLESRGQELPPSGFHRG